MSAATPSDLPPDDPEGTAGEYVLGTLSAREREVFTRAMAGDPGLRAMVEAWEARLTPLLTGAQAITPDPRTWAAIQARLGPRPVEAQVIRLQRTARRWRWAAISASVLAAALALWIAVSPRSSSDERQYLAVVNRGGALPPLVVRVDLAAGVVRVRSLATQTPDNRTLELWYVGAGASPRSLGVITAPAARFAIPDALRNTNVEGGSLAVSVEPPGGSPTGSPTGPVIYSGRLLQD